MPKSVNKQTPHWKSYKPGMYGPSTTLGEGIPGNVLDELLGLPAGELGELVAYTTPDVAPKSLENYSAASLLPGITGYREAKRTQLVDQYYSGGKRRNSATASEQFAGLVPAIALTALGALGLGAAEYIKNKDANTIIRDDNILKGVLRGGALGFGTAALISSIALLAGGRTGKTALEHRAYLADPHLVAKSLIIPGYADFNRGKRLRAMINRAI